MNFYSTFRLINSVSYCLSLIIVILPVSMLCADYDSRKMNLQIRYQRLVFAKNSGPLHLPHFYRKLREK